MGTTVSNTELITEARSWMVGEFGAYDDDSSHEVSAVLGKLADALEAATSRTSDVTDEMDGAL